MEWPKLLVILGFIGFIFLTCIAAFAPNGEHIVGSMISGGAIIAFLIWMFL